RNPLAAISNAVTVLEKLGAQDDDTARIRMIIGRQTHHLARLVDDLLDVARVTTGRIVVERQPVALGDATRRALPAFAAPGKTAAPSKRPAREKGSVASSSFACPEAPRPSRRRICPRRPRSVRRGSSSWRTTTTRARACACCCSSTVTK